MRALSLFLSLLFFCVQPSWAAEGAEHAQVLKRVEKRLAQELEEKGLPGLVVGIVLGDELVFAKALGWADRQTKRPARVNTLYRIGSVTKVFTASLLVKFRDRSLLRLDDPLADFLPGSIPVPTNAKGAAEITLRHLLTHSSGLPPMPVNLKRATPEQPFGATTRKELMAGLKQTRLVTPVGAVYAYSNLGFSLLGLVVEKVGRAPYAALLEEHLLGPLGMKRTGIDLDAELRKDLATPYAARDTSRVVPDWKLGAAAPAGGIASDLGDMARFISWQFSAGSDHNKVIKGASLGEMHRPQRLTGSWRGAIGLGWQVSPSQAGGDVVWHNGGMQGFRSWVGFVASDKVGVIVLSNCGKSVDELGRWLLDEAVSGFGTKEDSLADPVVLGVAKRLVGKMAAPPGDDLQEMFHPGFLKAVPAEKIKAIFSSLHGSHGACRIRDSRPGKVPRSLKVNLSCEGGKTLRLALQVDGSAEARIVFMKLN